jgi:hypothetical protein
MDLRSTMTVSLPATVLTISLAISLASVTQWRVVDRETVDRLAPRWRAAVLTLELAAMVVVLATGATIAYVILESGYTGKAVSTEDRSGLISAIGWQAGWLALSAIVPRVAALMPERNRATAVNLYGTLFGAFISVFIGLSAAIPLVGEQPSKERLLATVLPTALLTGFVGWFFAGWQTAKSSDVEPRLLDDELVPLNARYVYGGETVDVSLWQDGTQLYVTHPALDNACFQQRRIRREEERRGRPMAHTPRIIFAAPRFEPPVVREGRVTWRDRSLRRALALCARRSPLLPDGQEQHLPPHPQYIGLWQWPAIFDTQFDEPARLTTRRLTSRNDGPEVPIERSPVRSRDRADG